jgi:hypothetical protein
LKKNILPIRFEIIYKLIIGFMIYILTTNQVTNDENTRNASPAIISVSQAELEVKIVDPNKRKANNIIIRQSESNTIQASNVNNNNNNNNSSSAGGINTVDQEEDEEDDEIVLKYGAEHVIKLFIPVTICLLFVIISLSLITSYQESGGAHL